MNDDLIASNVTLPVVETRTDALHIDELVRQLSPGTRVGSHYVITRTLGSGGMGLVLLARDEQLMRDVALKFVAPGLFSHEGAQASFLSEARTMARVRHPNVVEVFSFGEHDGKPYFVMEYVPGITADTWYRERMMQTGTPAPVDEVLGIVEQCCRGVSAIHASGAIHGDLKPSNVLLGPAFRVALADFGLARVLEQGAHFELAGTPAYMAPETLLPGGAAHQLAERRDVYALAVMTYEFLTGHLPQPARTQLEASLMPLSAPLPPSHHRSDLPAVFDDVLLAALAIDPAQRTVSAETFRRALMSARRRASERTFGAKILAVDDDADFLALTDRTLRANFPGAQVTCVADASHALEELSRRSFDVAVVDLQLPDMSGLELTAAIRAEESQRRMPILVVTAFGGARDWQLLNKLGADGFLVKPLDPHSLAAMVGRLLEAPVQRK